MVLKTTDECYASWDARESILELSPVIVRLVRTVPDTTNLAHLSPVMSLLKYCHDPTHWTGSSVNLDFLAEFWPIPQKPCYVTSNTIVFAESFL